ncbi:MAG: HAD-IA family hydrolase [Methylocystaceae bacterium]
MIKHIVFDFDGTIADDKELGLLIINELADRHNYTRFTAEEFNNLNEYPLQERLKLTGVPFYRIPKLSLECLNIFRHLIHSVKTFDGIQELLADLRLEGFTLSIISSNALENIRIFLQKNNLQYFDHVASVKNLFGKHVSIKKYLKQYRLHADEIVYIGDELRDIEACKRLGVKVIAVTWGFDSLALIKRGKPDYIVSQPSEILDIVKTLKE